MVKFTHSKGKINAGLTSGAILGAAIPIIATIATGGVAAVGLPLWLALGGVVSGLFAGERPRSPHPGDEGENAEGVKGSADFLDLAAKISRGE